MPQKVIIDTDPGVDDAMATFFALRSPELNVIGLTTIFGNVHTELATTNQPANPYVGAPWQVTMVGLDVTHRVNMTPERLARYDRIDDPMARYIARIVPFYCRYFETDSDGRRGIFVHDSSAIACVIDPTLFRMERWPLRVETLGIGRGKTWPFIGSGNARTFPDWANRPLVNVCVDVDFTRLLALELSRMA